MKWDDEKQAILCRFKTRELKEEMKIDFQDAQLFNGQSNPRVHIEHFLQ